MPSAAGGFRPSLDGFKIWIVHAFLLELLQCFRNTIRITMSMVPREE